MVMSGIAKPNADAFKAILVVTSTSNLMPPNAVSQMKHGNGHSQGGDR
jgi:hypothetical protein